MKNIGFLRLGTPPSRSLLLFLCIFLLGSTHSNSQIPNNDFENWFIDSVGMPLLTNWTTSGEIMKDTDAYHGNYVLLLTGSFGSSGIAQTHLTLSYHPDTFKCHYEKAGLVSIEVNLYDHHLKVDSCLWAPPNNSWADTSYIFLSLPLSKTHLSSDSAAIVLKAISDAQNFFLTSTLLIDQLYFDDNETGISSEMTDWSFSLYPNPATNKLEVKLPNDSHQYQLKILNTLGQIIERQEFYSDQVSVDILGFPAGVYFIEFGTEKQKTIKKFVKQ